MAHSLYPRRDGADHLGLRSIFVGVGMALLGVFDGIVADGLRSDEARREISDQVSEALKNNTLASGVQRIIVDQIRLEREAVINQIKCTSKEVSAELTTELNREADRFRGRMPAQLEIFLRSTEGKELLTGLLMEALSRRELEVLIKDAQARLKEVGAHEVAALCADAEVVIQKSSEDHRTHLQREVDEFDRHAGATALTLIERVFREAEPQFQTQRDSLIASSWDEVHQRLDDFINLRLPRLLRRAVERHVASGPRFVQPHSNRWLAAELRITVREVKRRRRRGELPDFQSCAHES